MLETDKQKEKNINDKQSYVLNKNKKDTIIKRFKKNEHKYDSMFFLNQSSCL